MISKISSFAFIILVAGVLSTSSMKSFEIPIDPIIRPHSKALPSEYLDSIFVANSDKIMVVNFGDSSIAPSLVNIPGRLRHRLTLNDTQTSLLLPTNGCQHVNDTTIVVTSSTGYYAFLHPETGFVYKLVKSTEKWHRGLPIGARVSNNRVAVATSGPNQLTVYDDTSLVMQIPALLDLSYTSMFRNPLYRPSFGITNDAFYVQSVTNRRRVVQHIDGNGEVQNETIIPFWVRYTGVTFFSPAIWANEDYLIAGDHSLPYLLVYHRKSMEIYRIIALDGAYFRNVIQRQFDRSSSIAGASLYDVKFYGSYLYINFFNSLIRIDLTSTPDDVRWAYHRLHTDDHLYRTVGTHDERYIIADVDVINDKQFIVCLVNSNVVDFYEVYEP